jgi:hypothetical protein
VIPNLPPLHDSGKCVPIAHYKSSSLVSVLDSKAGLRRCLLDIPPAICQTFYGLGKLRSADTPEMIQEFYFYIGIFSLSFDISQPGCDGSADDFPTLFQNNVRHTTVTLSQSVGSAEFCLNHPLPRVRYAPCP